MNNFTRPGSAALPTFGSMREAGRFWFDYGFQVIPIVPNQKRPALQHLPWLEGLSLQKIEQHWSQHPDHDVGCILADDVIVLDADSPEAEAAMRTLEMEYGAAPRLIVRTRRGCHHYFRLAPETFARTDSHDGVQFPDRIDIRAGGSSIVLPPSGPRRIQSGNATSSDELTVVDQDFVDAVFRHNGRPEPRPVTDADPAGVEADPADLEILSALLKFLDPDCGYEDWLHALMAVFNATRGSDEGMALADSWSSQGSKYKGTREIEAKWRSFSLEAPNPVTIASLIARARDAGAEIDAIMMKGRDEFEPCEMEVVQPGGQAPTKVRGGEHPLDKYSLRGSSKALAKELAEATEVLADIALKGQLTVIYGPPNSGKTLLVLYLLSDAIARGLIDPSCVYYLNHDDTAAGLVEKLTIAEKYDFHMLSEGYKRFRAEDFPGVIDEIMTAGLAKDSVIILDTTKKFTDLMDKRIVSQFTGMLRPFGLKGGTIIALSHVNKKLGKDGKAIYAGTSDLRDDFDCAYLLETVPAETDAARRVVEFTNSKSRGNVAASVAYSYSLERGISYPDLLQSVRKVEQGGVASIRQAATLQSDAPLIEAIAACIREGINTKMEMKKTAAGRGGVSWAAALDVIEKYTGIDPAVHRWTYSVRAHGAKVYVLLDRSLEPPAGP